MQVSTELLEWILEWFLEWIRGIQFRAKDGPALLVGLPKELQVPAVAPAAAGPPAAIAATGSALLLIFLN